MRPRLFAQRSPDDPDRASLDREETRHLRSLRLRVGDRIEAILGPADVREAEIQTLARDRTDLHLGTALLAKSDPMMRTWLVVAIGELPRLDLLAEKATELGATEILFFRAARSQFAAIPRNRLERLGRIARSACAQSGRTEPPAIRQVENLADALKTLPTGTQVRAFSPGAAGTNPTAGKRDAALVIGPEGGFEEEELSALKAAGALITSLGPRILRFETAAIVALARSR